MDENPENEKKEEDIEIIPFGKSPIHEALEWLIEHEFILKQLSLRFGVPLKYISLYNIGENTESKNEGNS